jgi:hypothetical protein
MRGESRRQVATFERAARAWLVTSDGDGDGDGCEGGEVDRFVAKAGDAIQWPRRRRITGEAIV